ncbi:hypothetical protein FH972_026272 [Carpinus fangiana]|uniref:Metallo-beta-lactamase domain-containing protein n=1 Tax=Carpinus fangiana TaxID=176857 RepID=A0A5N6L3H7_9ROSI|nr:hypothetical protein FH972_026272 [Carpinus fangiana]
MAVQLPKLPDVERLSSRVIRVLGGNPGKRILLDTGEGHASYAPRLKSLLDSEKCSIERIILSHWHHDHINGVPSVRSLASADVPVYKHQPDFLNLNDGTWKSFENDHKFSIVHDNQSTTIRAVHSPGHTADHMAFLLEEEAALFTADAVLGHGTAVFDDLASYISTLNLFSSLADFTGRAYPGHGAVIEDGKAKVKEYIQHRAQREKQVLDVLSSEKSRDWSSMDIVKVVYKDVPEALHIPAEGGVKQVLEKLAGPFNSLGTPLDGLGILALPLHLTTCPTQLLSFNIKAVGLSSFFAQGVCCLSVHVAEYAFNRADKVWAQATPALAHACRCVLGQVAHNDAALASVLVTALHRALGGRDRRDAAGLVTFDPDRD